MARKPSESADNIAEFFGNLAAHLDMNNGVFMGDPEMTRTEAKRAQRELEALVNKYQDLADEHRVNDR